MNLIVISLLLLSAALPAAKPEASVISAEAVSPTSEADDMATPEATPTEAPTPDSSNLALLKRIEELEKNQAAVKIEGYGQVRYDNQRYRTASYSSLSTGPSILNETFNSHGGAYVKRLELKFSGKLLPKLNWVASYGLEEGKLKDVGVEWTDLPFFEGVKKHGYRLSLQLGQFRQKFGVEPQTGTTAVPFIERSMMNGGAHPLGTNLKFFGERALGAHAAMKTDKGAFRFDAGFSYTGDSVDQVKGTNTLGLAFPAEVDNGRVAQSARAGLQWVPESGPTGPLRIGVSHHVNDQAVRVTWTPSIEMMERLNIIHGADFYIEPIAKFAWLQAEFLKFSQSVGAATNSVGDTKTGFYVQGGARVPSIPELWGAGFELSGRYERVNIETQGAFPTYYSASTLGARFTYGKASHTAFNATFYAPEDRYEDAKNLAFFTVQQQFAF